MRNYDYLNKYPALLTLDIVSLLTQIHEYKGKQDSIMALKEDTLTHLIEVAHIQSTESSNRIEGVYTSDERLRLLVKDKTTPNTREEHEIAGYRDVLTTIHKNYEYIPPKPPLILQLHRDLYKFSAFDFAGKYKNGNNTIEEEDSSGNVSIRFQPVEAWETSPAMEALCKDYNDMINQGKIDSLLLIPMFVLDFLCIHPFKDGNGRMSRLITLLLLYRAGYTVGKYISIEKLIEQSKETYYATLKNSSIDWHEEKNDYEPFVKYTLGVLIAAYREFETRVLTLNLSKPERVVKTIQDTLGKVSKKELIKACPDISVVTIQRTLNSLIKKNDIIKIGDGRYTTYTWNREKE